MRQEAGEDEGEGKVFLDMYPYHNYQKVGFWNQGQCYLISQELTEQGRMQFGIVPGSPLDICRNSLFAAQQQASPMPTKLGLSGYTWKDLIKTAISMIESDKVRLMNKITELVLENQHMESIREKPDWCGLSWEWQSQGWEDS